MVRKIVKAGFSKIPVYKGKNKNKVVGILKAKSLIDYNDNYLDQSIEESGLKLLESLIVPKDTSMLEMLMLFQEHKTAIALVCEDTVKNNQVPSLYSVQI